jgi:hypothetical protein
VSVSRSKARGEVDAGTAAEFIDVGLCATALRIFASVSDAA